MLQDLDFIGKLHNKSVNVGEISPTDFGKLSADDTHTAFHELLAAVIPQVEHEYLEELQADNKIHLSAMMSMLSRFMRIWVLSGYPMNSLKTEYRM